MKRGKTDVKLTTRKVSKFESSVPKMKKTLKCIINRRLAAKHNSNKSTYTEKLMDNLIFNKNTHISVAFRDCMMQDFSEEFLKRYYKVVESKERVPKIANYYKNYLTFFCNPVFRDFRSNSIIQAYSDNKAELYYKKTYNTNEKETKKSKNQNGSNLFNSLVRDDINNHVLTEISEDRRNNDNSLFNDEFFIYRPEKKRAIAIGDETSFLDFSRNNSHIKSGLLTVQEDDILGIVSNLNRPINECIMDKIQKGTNKKVGKSTYNYSTTDKSKADDASNYLNNLARKNTNDALNGIKVEVIKGKDKENRQVDKERENICRETSEANCKEGKKIDAFKLVNSVNSNSVAKRNNEGKNINSGNNNGSGITPGSNGGAYSTLAFTTANHTKNSNPVLVHVQIGNLTNTAKTIECSHSNKTSIPITVKNNSSSKLITCSNPSINIPNSTASGNISKANPTATNQQQQANSKIDFKATAKYEYKAPNTQRFANLLYASESKGDSNSNSNINNAIQRPSSSTKTKAITNATNNSNSNSQSVNTNNLNNLNTQRGPVPGHHRSIKSIDVTNKFNIDLETPTYQIYKETKYLESNPTSKPNEEKHTCNMYLNLNKFARVRQKSTGNAIYDNLLLKGKETTTSKNNDIDSYINDNKTKLKKLNSENYISNTKTKQTANNYVSKNVSSGTTKISAAQGDSSAKLMSSMIKTNTVTANNQVKIKFVSERVTRDTSARGTSKGKNTSNFNEYQGSVTTKNHSKPKDGSNQQTSSSNLNTEKSANNKKTPTNRRMKSNEFFSNNYLITKSSNMNMFLQKICTTRNLGGVALE